MHDKVAQVIHWDLSEKRGFERELNWYDHKPNPVCESERYKLLWDLRGPAPKKRPMIFG